MPSECRRIQRIPRGFRDCFFNFSSFETCARSNRPTVREREKERLGVCHCEGLFVFNFKQNCFYVSSHKFCSVSCGHWCLRRLLDTSVLRCCCLDQSSQLGVVPLTPDRRGMLFCQGVGAARRRRRGQRSDHWGPGARL